jgi:hypothetical protein
MDANTNLVSLAQQFSELPMEDLIGGPLNATAKANAAMALTQTRFLLETCFSKKKVGDKKKDGDGDKTDDAYTYSPIMIEMTLERPVLSPNNGTDADKKPFQVSTATTMFNLPLITIIPINSLGVDNVTIDFEMEVKSSYSETEDTSKSSETSAKATLEGKLGWGPLSVSIKGSASYSSKDSATHNTHYEKSNSAKYTVNVHAGQLPVPKGVNTIIEAFTQNIQPIDLTSNSDNNSNT